MCPTFGKETIDTNTGKSTGQKRLHLKLSDLASRALTPDEVRMLDNVMRFCSFVGELPVMPDFMYDILKHLDVALTVDGKPAVGKHGEDQKHSTIETWRVDPEDSSLKRRKQPMSFCPTRTLKL